MLIVASTAAAAIGAAGAYVFTRQKQARADHSDRPGLSAEIAENESARLKLKLDRVERRRDKIRDELALAEASLAESDDRVTQRQKSIERREGIFNERDMELTQRFEELKERRQVVKGLREEINHLEALYLEELERISGQQRKDAEAIQIQDMLEEANLNSQKAIKAFERDVQGRCETEAKRLMDLACQRYGTPLSANRLISTVQIPEKKKARDAIMADDRAVLKAITAATDVDFIEQEGETFFMQAPDPFTREVGRLAFQRLVRSGRFSEALATAASAKARVDLEKIARDAGQRASKLLRLKGIHPDILFLVGKLLYRTSYTQNQWQHAIETAHLCGMMAEELGLEIRSAQRSALLHDIGKVLWAETEAVGSHAVSGATFAREHGEVPEIVHPIAAHHNDEKPSTPLAHLVAAADALSGARPGARRETVEAYTRRVDDIEAICADFKQKGVRRAYVIQGGREVRVHVDPRRIDDLAATRLSTDVARRIEEECIYPGQIKVVVLRETQSQATARA